MNQKARDRMVNQRLAELRKNYIPGQVHRSTHDVRCLLPVSRLSASSTAYMEPWDDPDPDAVVAEIWSPGDPSNQGLYASRLAYAAVFDPETRRDARVVIKLSNGEHRGFGKILSDEAAKVIRWALRNGKTYRTMAGLYGVSAGLIGKIKFGQPPYHLDPRELADGAEG